MKKLPVLIIIIGFLSFIGLCVTGVVIVCMGDTGDSKFKLGLLEASTKRSCGIVALLLAAGVIVTIIRQAWSHLHKEPPMRDPEKCHRVRIKEYKAILNVTTCEIQSLLEALEKLVDEMGMESEPQVRWSSYVDKISRAMVLVRRRLNASWLGMATQTHGGIIEDINGLLRRIEDALYNRREKIAGLGKGVTNVMNADIIAQFVAAFRDSAKELDILVHKIKESRDKGMGQISQQEFGGKLKWLPVDKPAWCEQTVVDNT